VTQDSTSVVAASAVEQAQTSAQTLSQPLVINASDALTNISNTVSNQPNLVTSFDALMKKREVLVKVGDEVAKVCFSVFFSLPHELNSLFLQKDPSLCPFRMAGAFRRNEGESCWMIFVLFPDIYLFDQMVQAQQARDLKILDLVRAMDSSYSFVVSADEEPPCSSRYRRTNTEANDRMRLFHSRICATQL
jgi:hypothetical protein